ncbi:hypothetical protein PASE110613_09260 [Paenibacillus sediminis]|uniref:Uncharacterized protein n=1 Tax=Paenibacillus sediminis TaxID=664909 RepID=A0ABS4H6J5_9BACL|nr:hypothetical protein [Paenibacillus sediminis]MBP1938165.1 hypothetical protein [Paenibacillus sediminis]
MIDGRKAIVTNKGKEYTTYKGFANQLGYPEAAAFSDSSDVRKKLRNGDEVTLIVSGEHPYDRDRLIWVIESGNGEKHLIGGAGLSIQPHTPRTLLATKRAQLAQLTAEIAQIEAELTIKPGDWVRVIYRSHHDAFSDGDIVRVVLTDTTNIPYNVVSFDGKMSDWTTADSVVKITPTEAKAALLAEIEALFNPQEVA